MISNVLVLKNLLKKIFFFNFKDSEKSAFSVGKFTTLYREKT